MAKSYNNNQLLEQFKTLGVCKKYSYNNYTFEISNPIPSGKDINRCVVAIYKPCWSKEYVKENVMVGMFNLIPSTFNISNDSSNAFNKIRWGWSTFYSMMRRNAPEPY